MRSQQIQAKVAPSWTTLCGDLVNKTQSLALSSLKVNYSFFFFFFPRHLEKTTILAVAQAALCFVLVCLLFFSSCTQDVCIVVFHSVHHLCICTTEILTQVSSAHAYSYQGEHLSSIYICLQDCH